MAIFVNVFCMLGPLVVLSGNCHTSCAYLG